MTLIRFFFLIFDTCFLEMDFAKISNYRIEIYFVPFYFGQWLYLLYISTRFLHNRSTLLLLSQWIVCSKVGCLPYLVHLLLLGSVYMKFFVKIVCLPITIKHLICPRENWSAWHDSYHMKYILSEFYQIIQVNNYILSKKCAYHCGNFK
jgi:hypothetical protein